MYILHCAMNFLNRLLLSKLDGLFQLADSLSTVHIVSFLCSFLSSHDSVSICLSRIIHLVLLEAGTHQPMVNFQMRFIAFSIVFFVPYYHNILSYFRYHSCEAWTAGIALIPCSAHPIFEPNSARSVRDTFGL